MSRQDVEAPVIACAKGEIAANVALARLISAAASEQAARDTLALVRRRLARTDEQAARVDTMQALWDETPGAWQTVKAVLRHADHERTAATPREWAAVFDRAADVSPRAGVALYSLGRADLLDQTTVSIVARLREWGLIRADTVALDVGCGAGRMVVALARGVGFVTGIDVSASMVRAARRRCRSIANSRIVATTGEDLAAFDDRSFDLVLAVDVFPYLVSSAGSLAARHVAESARVLHAGGALVILNYSYRGDNQADIADVQRFAGMHGFAVRRIARNDFALWDGTTYLLQKLA